MSKNLLWLIIFLFFQSCIEEPPVTVLSNSENSESPLLLSYIESTGRYRFNEGKTETINSYQLYVSLGNYHVIDVRSREDFLSGHISGSVNIAKNRLIDHLRGLDSVSAKAKVLVCRNGFESAFLACLAKLDGLNNVLVLRYGMAAWNADFAYEWMNNINTYPGDLDYYLDNYILPQFPHTPLPMLNELEGNNTEEKLHRRIVQVLNDINTIDFQIVNPKSIFFRFTDAYNYYDYTQNKFENPVMICYGDQNLFQLSGSSDPNLPSHPPGTRNINPPVKNNHLSDDYIQKIPSDKLVLIYSSDGHDSAYLCAYLRVLGYETKSMLFGANSFGWNRMINNQSELIREDAFIPQKVLNLPYETGENP